MEEHHDEGGGTWSEIPMVLPNHSGTGFFTNGKFLPTSSLPARLTLTWNSGLPGS